MIAVCEQVRDLARVQAAEGTAGPQPGTLRLLDGIAAVAAPLDDAYDLAYEMSLPADRYCGMCGRSVALADGGAGWQHLLVR